ncbi:PhzF family phenazine biosynthesis protein [Streptomyces sp. NPDC008343]|uniref:PhzF family phenazine biosynthesis protein n=1 Tax=Streptomyces sp. NPDC008343 TaxID=3364828 RepID=UPI0036EC6904
MDGGGKPQHAEHLVQECAAGLVTVRRGEDTLSFAAPPRVRAGVLDDDYLKRIVSAFGVTRERVVTHQRVDDGPGWAVLQLSTAEEVLALEPDLALIPDAMVGANGVCPEGSEYAFELRAFAPGAGVPEDPGCGSMNATVGRWLTSTDPRALRLPGLAGREGRTGSEYPRARSSRSRRKRTG